MRIIDWSSDVCFSDLTVTPLHNGEQAYPRMLAAIAAARETIWLGTYIFDNDAVGQQFVAALSQAKSRGVQVKVLIDETGERYSWPRIGLRLQQAGIDIASFNPDRKRAACGKRVYILVDFCGRRII